MTRVLVTGAGGGGIGEQIVKSLRNGVSDYYIICSDTRFVSIAKEIGDEFVMLPFASAKNYVDELISFCVTKNVQMLFPGSEPELNVIASNIKAFQAQNIQVPINTIELINLCSDKLQFNAFLEKNDFSVCETILIDQSFNVSILKNYPYVIKPYKGSGSSNVFIVQNETELKSILAYLGTEMNFILQQYVGDLENEYTVGILSDPLNGYVQHIILKRDLSLGLSIKQRVKNNSSNPEFGNTLGISTGISQGAFVDNPLISEAVFKLVKLLKPTSTINMQCRVYKGKAYIFEVNPRFSGTSNLRALVGFNEPEYLINCSLNLPNPKLDENQWLGKTVLRGLKEFKISNDF